MPITDAGPSHSSHSRRGRSRSASPHRRGRDSRTSPSREERRERHHRSPSRDQSYHHRHRTSDHRRASRDRGSPDRSDRRRRSSADRKPSLSPASKRRPRSMSSSSSSSTDDHARDRKHSKRKSKKKHRKHRSSSVESSDDDRRKKETREERKERKRKKREKKEKKKAKKENSSKHKGVIHEYGKFGIISEADMYTKDQEFRAWMVEEKMLNPETVPQPKMKELFRVYMEDYNTATLPHEKYYALEKYEARMDAIRSGHTAAISDTYDPRADEAALAAQHKRVAKTDGEVYIGRAQLEELRKIERERVEASRMKRMGMEVKESMGVRYERD